MTRRGTGVVALQKRIQGNDHFRRKTLFVKSGSEVEAHRSSERSKGVGSHTLDVYLWGCIIQRTYGFGLAPLARGKLFQG
jgi:hypothetical protein